jgi:hypothetical protein
MKNQKDTTEKFFADICIAELPVILCQATRNINSIAGQRTKSMFYKQFEVYVHENHLVVHDSSENITYTKTLQDVLSQSIEMSALKFFDSL